MRHVVPELNDEPIWLQIARKELGVREGRDDNRIVQYHQATKLKAQSSKTSWCASFVAWCYEQAGIRSLRSARAADWVKFGRETYLEPGALIVLSPPATGKANPDNANSGHVGFLVGVDGAQIQLLSGNSSNCVHISPYDASRIVAIRWPLAQ